MRRYDGGRLGTRRLFPSETGTKPLRYAGRSPLSKSRLRADQHQHVLSAANAISQQDLPRVGLAMGD